MKSTIALIYDFDGTLTPGSMQEYTILPEIGVKPNSFWKEVNDEVKKTGAESVMTYMRLTLKKAAEKDIPVTAARFRSQAGKIRYFKGVPAFFKAINRYSAKTNGRLSALKHYIISGGLKEILVGTSIAKNFNNIFACEYYYDEYGKAVFPKVVVNSTMKTQYIFRINKGKEDPSESINEHMDENKRPVPFKNMLYIGDGMTDVPSMAVIKKNGGRAIAVYKPKDTRGYRTCKELLKAGRVDFIAEADYREGSQLVKYIKLIIDTMSAEIKYSEELAVHKAKNSSR
jgi:2-hydroxy-3-keto-5-methylthiopentenyl-1-phosphate phosphatase